MTTYYVRSTGEVVGPNYGQSLGRKNRERKEFGNLFTSRKRAEFAAKLIRLVLKITKESIS
jgi:hypothetical protein